MEYSLVSGGVDSTLGYKLFCDNSIPVFIHYSNYSDRELEECKKLYGDDLRVIRTSVKVDGFNSVFIPARNLTFLSMIVSFLPNATKINIFGLKDDNQIDKSSGAFSEFSRMLSKYSKRVITVQSPTINYTKENLIKKAIKNGISIDYIINNTYSCYKGEAKECMSCQACIRKYIAISNISKKRLVSEELVRNYKTENPFRIQQIKKYLNGTT